MQHYAEPTQNKAVTKESIIGPYFKAVEDGLAEKESEKKELIKQYASVIAERVMMKESKDDYVPPKEADYGPEYQDMVKRVAAQEKRKQNKQPYRSPQNEEIENPQDAVTLDIPLMIRLFEYAREDAKTDMDLHDVAERLIHLSSEGRTLTMDDYADICPTSDVDESAPPGKKAERMVKHIKASYAKDGKLTDKEKSIAFATAWKAKNSGKV
jgi:hypothetical protein